MYTSVKVKRTGLTIKVLDAEAIQLSKAGIVEIVGNEPSENKSIEQSDEVKSDYVQAESTKSTVPLEKKRGRKPKE